MLQKALRQSESTLPFEKMLKTKHQIKVEDIRNHLLSGKEINCIMAQNDFNVKRGELAPILDDLTKSGLNIHREVVNHYGSDIYKAKLIVEFDSAKYNGIDQPF
uniref:Uncharacterized protein n=1 Tax=uncultured marine virus TaxID=186617 RepID=A0A0F7L8Z9_9VIRU|nr:hypothetical protein [uncultured marine virus]